MNQKTVNTLFSLPLLGTLAALVAPVAHAEDEAAPWSVIGNASLVSDYLFRGISQTQHRPTWQITMEADHTSGFYAGTFGSGVSNAAYTNGSGSEIDLYGGWRKNITDAVTYDLGVVTYWYPGARYEGPDGSEIKFHTQELKAALNAGTFNITGWVSPTRTWFGFAYDPMTGERRSTRGTAYYEANWNPVLADGWVLNLHAGTQRFRGIEEYDFVDLKAGVTWTTGRWALAAAVTHNNGDAMRDGKPVWTFYDQDGTGRNVAGTRALLSATYSF